MNPISCIVCGFDKKVELHHIIKWKDLGSDKQENLVPLCPNHHWIADFGTSEDRIEILKTIKQITGKIGSKISNEEEKVLDLKVRLISQDVFKKAVWDEEWWKEFKLTSNYLSTLNWLRGRGCPRICSIELNDKAEKLLLIKKIQETIDYRYA